MVNRLELTRARLLGGLAIASLIACKKPPPAVGNGLDAGPPVDHLSRDEVPEGTEKAFTLLLPKAAIVSFRLEGEVIVDSDLTPEQLSNYVRRHVQTTKVTAGASTTTFDDAIVPAEPKTHLRIEIRRPPTTSMHRSTMYVRDVTSPPSPPKTTDADAYRAAGRNPDGTPLNPKQMF